MAEIVAGCGIDIEELIRFKKKKFSEKEVDGFSEMVYSADEISNNLKSSADIRFPLCFSCKEAFFKALGVSWTNSDISWKDIELLFPHENDLLNYNVRLSGYARELYEEKRCRRYETHLEINDEFVVVQVVLFS